MHKATITTKMVTKLIRIWTVRDNDSFQRVNKITWKRTSALVLFLINDGIVANVEALRSKDGLCGRLPVRIDESPSRAVGCVDFRHGVRLVGVLDATISAFESGMKMIVFLLYLSNQSNNFSQYKQPISFLFCLPISFPAGRFSPPRFWKRWWVKLELARGESRRSSNDLFPSARNRSTTL